METTELEVNAASLYNADYLQWIETTVAQLKAGNFGQIDWNNLIEEIEDMGRSRYTELKALSPANSFNLLPGFS